MSDKELVKRLRKRHEFESIDGYKRIEWEDEDALEAADRIEQLVAINEALTAEREFFEESWVYAADKLAKAMSRAKKVTSFEDTTEELAECGCARCKAHLKLRALLAEIEGEKG